MITRDVPLDEIVLDERTEIRPIDDAIVAHYAERMLAGDKFPPAKLREVDGALVMGAGRHRLWARKVMEADALLCSIEPGTIDDALLDAIEENGRHGLPMTKETRKEAVRKLLFSAAWGKKPQAWIAKRCQVAQSFVSATKADMEKAGELSPVIIRGGAGRPKGKGKSVAPPTTAPPATEPKPDQPLKKVLFPNGDPTDEEAAADLGVKLTPELAAFGAAFEEGRRTAPPGATTIVASDKKESHDQTVETGTATEGVDGGAGVLPGGLRGISDSVRGPDGGANGGPLEQVGGAAVSAGEPAVVGVEADPYPYPIDERIALLKTSPVSQGCPAEDEPAFAAALREWADSLAPADLTALGAHVQAVTDERDRLAARVRELEATEAQAVEANQGLQEEMKAAWNAIPYGVEIGTGTTLPGAITAAIADAAHRGYQQGEAEALGWVAGHLGIVTDEGEEAARLRERIEERIREDVLREEDRQVAEEIADGTEINIGLLRPARAKAQKQAATDEHGAVCCPVCGGVEGCRDKFCGCHDGTIVGRPEPVVERDPEHTPRPKKAAKGKAPKPALTLPPRRLVGDQVLVETKKHGTRRAVVALSNPDGTFCFVLRADVGRGLKGGAGERTPSADRLRPDPGLGDRKAAIVEAIGILEEHVNVPVTWVEALRAARETA